MDFMNNFVSLCESKGVAPTAVLVALGMSKGNYAAWKEGRIPKIQQLQKIADYFNVSVDYLLGNKTEKAATLSDDGYSEKKKSLLKAVEQMTEEQAAALLMLWEQFKAER